MYSPFLAENAPELLPERLVGKEHMEDLQGPSRPPRMPLNLARKLNKQQEGWREGN